MNHTKYNIIALLLFLYIAVVMTGCSDYSENDIRSMASDIIEKEREDAYEIGKEDGYVEGYQEGKKDGLAEELLSPREEYFIGWIGFLDETSSYSEDMETLIGLADKVGCCPSTIVGTYYFDTSTWFIHMTDSECLSNVDYENFYPCILYDCYTKEQIDEEIKENDYLKSKNIKYCPVCMK